MENFIYDLNKKEVREQLTRTLQIIQDTITSTLGPKGRNVILYEQGEMPHITKDGVTVAEFLTFDNPMDEAINKIIKETARKTAEKVGDGTTTSILLATELIIRLLPKWNDIFLEIEMLKKDAESLKQVIQEMRIDLTAFEDEKVLDMLTDIVAISSNGDQKVVDMLEDVLKQIGPNGLIDVVDGYGEETTTHIMEGMLIEAPAHLIHNDFELKEAYVALVSSKIEKIHEIKSMLRLANVMHNEPIPRPLIVIANEFSKEVLNIINVNNRNGKTAIFPVDIDGFANNMLDILDDMSTILECKVLSTDSTSPYGLQNIEANHLGYVESATITPQHSVLYAGTPMSEEALKIKAELESFISAIKKSGENRIGEIRGLEKRLSKFSKSAKIRVGGATEAARKELKDRIEDAVQAVASSVNNGIVPGGGYTLYKASVQLRDGVLKDIAKLPAQKLNATVGNRFDLDRLIVNMGMVIDFRKEEPGFVEKTKIYDPADVLIKALEQAVAITEIMLKGYGVLVKVYD